MTMTMDPKIACIGTGTWGKNLVRNFHALGMLSCVCETSPERRAELSVEYPATRLTDSIEEVLADPQVAGVAIATPAETHGDLVQRALPAGKDVFVEKPPTVTPCSFGGLLLSKRIRLKPWRKAIPTQKPIETEVSDA